MLSDARTFRRLASVTVLSLMLSLVGSFVVVCLGQGFEAAVERVLIEHRPAECWRPNAYVLVEVDTDGDYLDGTVQFRADDAPIWHRAPMHWVYHRKASGLLRAWIPRIGHETSRVEYRISLTRADYRQALSQAFVLSVRASCTMPTSTQVPTTPPILQIASEDPSAPDLPQGFLMARSETPAPHPNASEQRSSSGISRTVTWLGVGAVAGLGSGVYLTGRAPDPTELVGADSIGAGRIPVENDRVVAGLTPCFRQTFAGQCGVLFDGSCSRPADEIDDYTWFTDVTEAVGPTQLFSGRIVRADFPDCDGDWIFVRLQITSKGRVASETHQVRLPLGFAARAP